MFAFPLPRNDFGTWLTLAIMRSRVIASIAHPVVREVAVSIASQAGSKNGTEQAVAIRHYVEGHTQFLRDPDGAELLHDPVWQVRRILTQGTVYADCDDVAMLAAALGKAVGLRARFVVVGFHENGPLQHVWTELRSPAGGPWVELDTTREAQNFNWGAIKRRMIWRV